MAKLTNKDAKETAKRLYLTGQHQQKEIAKIVGRTENTISRWVRDEKWELLRANLTTTKENVLANFYAQISAINTAVENREEGERVVTSKEADVIVKLTSSIKSLEREAGIAEISSVCIRVSEFVRKNYGLEKAQEINLIFDALIEEIMK